MMKRPSESFNDDLHNLLIEACQHLEWLVQRTKTTESGNSLGIAMNAKQFLERDDVHAIRVAHAQIVMAQELAAKSRAKKNPTREE